MPRKIASFTPIAISLGNPGNLFYQSPKSARVVKTMNSVQRMPRKAERIDSVVKSIIERLNRQSNPTSEDIKKIWKEVVGRKAFPHTSPASLRKKRLVINVDTSTWLYELTLRKDDLLARLKKRLGEDKIKELQFRIGEL